MANSKYKDCLYFWLDVFSYFSSFKMHTFIITEVIKIMRWKTLLEVCVFTIFKFSFYDIITLRCHCTRKYTNEILFAEHIYCNCVHVCKRDAQQLIKSFLTLVILPARTDNDYYCSLYWNFTQIPNFLHKINKCFLSQIIGM